MSYGRSDPQAWPTSAPSGTTRSVEFERRFMNFPKAKMRNLGYIFSHSFFGGELAGAEFMSNEAVITVSNDPLRSVADALDAAVQGAKGGVKDVRAAASRTLPDLSRFFSGLTYKTCYAVSYGIVFPTALVADRKSTRLNSSHV